MQPPPLEPDRFWQPVNPPSTATSRDPLRPSGPEVTAMSLLRVVGGSILVALLLVAGLVTFYGKNEQSIGLQQLLIAPHQLQQLSFTEVDPVTKRQVVYSVDKILLSAPHFEKQALKPYSLERADLAKEGREKVPARTNQAVNQAAGQAIELNSDEYRELYELIKTDFSLPFVNDQLQKRFEDSATLTQILIKVYPQDRSGKLGKSQILQTIEFIGQGHDYRISVRHEDESTWRYFEHEESLNPFLRRLAQAR